MSVDLLLAAMVPLAVALWWTGSQSSAELTHAARRNSALLARSMASRLDQLILDTTRFVQSVAEDERVIALCLAPKSEHGSEVFQAAMRRLELAERTNPDCASAFITDARGMGIASTNPKNIGMDLSFRTYCQDALAGNAHISELLVGKTTGEPGVYFAAPVRAPGDEQRVIGAAVFKLRGELVQQIVAELRVGEQGFALLADRHGVVIAHPNAALLYHSLAPLSPQQEAAVDAQTAFSIERIKPLGAPDLLTAARAAASLPWESHSFAATEGFGDGSKGEWVSGAGRMRMRGWTVFVVEPASQFNRAAEGLAQRNLAAAVAVAALAAGLALWRARGIVRPLLDLKAAANRLAEGDFSARAPQHSDDEVGQLAATFNQMVPKLQEAVEFRQALEVATEVQQSLLPEGNPPHAQLEIAGRCKYCDQTGGDYFDFIDIAPTDSGATLIAVGDVMGHGLPAALLMASARAALRCPAGADVRLSEMLGRVNHVLSSDRNFRFMTLTLLVVDPKAASARWASAGHDPPIVYSAVRKDFAELEGGDVPLGVDEATVYEEYSRGGFAAGDLIFLGTDGIWEATNDAGEFFGKDRLRDILKRHHTADVSQIADIVEHELKEFRGSVPQADDVTFVIIRLRANADALGR
jgi:serine phosphatase RsbU (regulator of sigma subunit)